MNQESAGTGTGTGLMTIKSYERFTQNYMYIFYCGSPSSLIQTKWLCAVFEDDLLALGLLYPWRLICEHMSLS